MSIIIVIILSSGGEIGVGGGERGGGGSTASLEIETGERDWQWREEGHDIDLDGA